MRVHDWDVRLHRTVAEFRNKPFAWGEADCLQFAGACVEAVRGDNPAAAHAGAYDGALDAARVLIGLGAHSAPELLDAMFEAIPLGHAQRGDLALLRAPSDEDPFGAAGVVLGAVIAGYGEDGLVLVPFTDGIKAWAVR